MLKPIITMTQMLKSCFPFIAIEGWPIIGTFCLVTLIFLASFALISPETSPVLKPMALTLGGISGLLVLFSLWFFRDPERMPDSDSPNAVISPADGRVLKIEKVNNELYGSSADMGSVMGSEKISIFMSPLNVHVNRAPVDGVVEKIQYFPGKFFAANLDKASEENEKNFVLMKTQKGQKVGFMQIAGFIARRIVCHAKVGQAFKKGERYGMIRFGSRMEIFLPPGTKIFVKSGEKVLAGKTIIGELLE